MYKCPMSRRRTEEEEEEEEETAASTNTCARILFYLSRAELRCTMLYSFGENAGSLFFARARVFLCMQKPRSYSAAIIAMRRAGESHLMCF